MFREGPAGLLPLLDQENAPLYFKRTLPYDLSREDDSVSDTSDNDCVNGPCQDMEVAA